MSGIASCGGGGTSITVPPPSGGLAAGTANITGQVIEGSGGRIVSTVGDSLNGIHVSLIATASGRLAGSTVTDAQGKYRFNGVASEQEYLLKLALAANRDLNGDSINDQVELALPIKPADRSSMSLRSQLGLLDSDNDGQDDSVVFDNQITDDQGASAHKLSEHRLRAGQTVADDNGNGTVSDDTPFDDRNNDGIADDNGGAAGGHGADDGLTEKELAGVITAISAASVTVAGQTFAITSATQFLGAAHETLTAAAFTVGTPAEVEGLSDGNGGFTALKLKLEDSGNTGGSDDQGGNGGSSGGSDDGAGHA